MSDIDNFIGIMEMPDKDFDKIFPLMMERVKSIYNNPAYEEDLLNNLRLEFKRNPDFNIQEQIAATNAFIEEFKKEDGLSQNKKDFLFTVLKSSMDKFEELSKNPRERIDVKIQRINDNAVLPSYAHPTDAGADVSACEEITINPGETKLVGTGLKVAIPSGYEIQLRPRSGMSLKTGLRVANSPATIDSDYRGEIKVIMWNSGATPYTIKIGDKIAQMLVVPCPMIRWNETVIEDETSRGEGGFGSSGT
jgi:dUTP pyrophosphatase